MPIKTTDKKNIINQLFIRIASSLLMKKYFEEKDGRFFWNIKKIKIADNINTNKKQRIKTPLKGSLAKV